MSWRAPVQWKRVPAAVAWRASGCLALRAAVTEARVRVHADVADAKTPRPLLLERLAVLEEIGDVRRCPSHSKAGDKPFDEPVVFIGLLANRREGEMLDEVPKRSAGTLPWS